MTNAIQITKMTKVEIPTEHQKDYNGAVAFQMVKFEYNFYGSPQVDCLDTKIMSDGRQIVIDGNGFIKSGVEI